MTAASWLVVAAYLALTAVAHLPGVGRRVRHRDPFGLIPSWALFAPNPGISDHFLLVRQHTADAGFSPWRVCWRDKPTRGRWLWRPTKRISKLLLDCSAGISSCVGHADEILTAEFLLLGSWAENACDPSTADGFQFALIEVPGWWFGNRMGIIAYRSPLLSLSARHGSDVSPVGDP